MLSGNVDGEHAHKRGDESSLSLRIPDLRRIAAIRCGRCIYAQAIKWPAVAAVGGAGRVIAAGVTISDGYYARIWNQQSASAGCSTPIADSVGGVLPAMAAEGSSTADAVRPRILCREILVGSAGYSAACAIVPVTKPPNGKPRLTGRDRILLAGGRRSVIPITPRPACCCLDIRDFHDYTGGTIPRRHSSLIEEDEEKRSNISPGARGSASRKPSSPGRNVAQSTSDAWLPSARDLPHPSSAAVIRAAIDTPRQAETMIAGAREIGVLPADDRRLNHLTTIAMIYDRSVTIRIRKRFRHCAGIGADERAHRYRRRRDFSGICGTAKRRDHRGADA